MDDLLKKKNVSLDELLHNQDVQYEYRMKNPKLLAIIMKQQNLLKLIETFQKSLDKVILKRIIGLCISPNQMIIMEIGQDSELTHAFLKVLESPLNYHRFIVSSICNIYTKIIELATDNVFKIFSVSEFLFSSILRQIHMPAVFQLAAKLCLYSSKSEPIIWTILQSLLGNHGIGTSLPKRISSLDIIKGGNVNLYQEQRIRAIELLIIYFTSINGNFVGADELFAAVSECLPLLLMDSSTDYERSLVFRLGLLLQPSSALGYSAVSIINSFGCTDVLLVAAIEYITSFDVFVGPRSIELFLYRLLHRYHKNNFLLIASCRMITKCVSMQRNNSELLKNLRGLILRCYKTEKLSLLVRAFKGPLLSAADGIELDPLSKKCTDDIFDARLNNDKTPPDIEDRVREYRTKARAIDEGRSSIMLIYDAKTLWRDEAKKYSEKFLSIEKINVQKMPAEIPPSSPSARSQATLGRRGSSSSDEFFLEEIDVTDPYPFDKIEFREVQQASKASPTKQLPPITVLETTKEPLPASPIKIEEPMIPKASKVTTPRAKKSVFIEPIEADDITLDAPSRPPVIVIPDDKEEEISEDELRKLITKQLQSISASESSITLMISNSVEFSINEN